MANWTASLQEVMYLTHAKPSKSNVFLRKQRTKSSSIASRNLLTEDQKKGLMKTASIIMGMMAAMLLLSKLVSKWTHPDIYILSAILGYGALTTWSLSSATSAQRRLNIKKRLEALKAKDANPVKGISELYQDILKKLAKEDLSDFKPNDKESVVELARKFMKKRLGISDKRFDELLKKSKNIVKRRA